MSTKCDNCTSNRAKMRIIYGKEATLCDKCAKSRLIRDLKNELAQTSK